MRNKQLQFFTKQQVAYGGVLLKTRKGRSQGRPLAVKQTMHLVLRSTKAVQERSFLKRATAHKIQQILKKFSEKYGVKLLSVANVGNHLHIHLKLSNRRTYAPFIRAITSAIAMAASGTSRWCTKAQKGIKKFWDYRPFTKVVESHQYFLNLKDYVQINKFEGQGYSPRSAKAMVWMSSSRWRQTAS